MKIRNKKMILAAAMLAAGGGACAQDQLTLVAPGQDDCALMLNPQTAVEFVTSGIVASVASDPDSCLATSVIGDGGGTGGRATLSSNAGGSLDPGDEFQLNWHAPLGFACVIDGDGTRLTQFGPVTDAQKVGSWTTSAPASNNDRNVLYSMSCSETNVAGGSDVTSSSLVVSVNGSGNGGGDPDPVGTACTSTLQNYSRVTTISFQRNNQNRTGSSYEDLFGEFNAPSSTVEMNMKTNQYVSMPFRTGGTGQVAKLIWEQKAGNPEEIRVSVAQCFGVPTPQNRLSEGCYVQGGGSAGLIQMHTVGSSSGCALQPNTDYFLNVAYTRQDGTSGCGLSGGCTWLVREN